MRYAGIFVLMALLAFATAAPAAAQQRGNSQNARVSQDDDDRRGRSETGTRARTGKRTETATRTENGRRSTRSGRVERTERRDTQSGPIVLGRRGGDEVYGNKDAGKRGNGPKFCRNGEGHPVHGRQWCYDKGFGLGHDGGVFDDRREDRRYPTRTENRTILDDILGRYLND